MLLAEGYTVGPEDLHLGQAPEGLRVHEEAVHVEERRSEHGHDARRFPSGARGFPFAGASCYAPALAVKAATET
jgi:hypothetical protein